VRRMIDRGELGHYRVGRLVRVGERQFQEYLTRVQGGGR
jgi:excisionase family DNA binding protein